jgi:peptide/nickel transport system permease protein
VRLALRRLGELFALLLVVTTLLFFLLRAAGDPATVLVGPDATPAAVEEVRRELGLDQPLPVQYARYVAALLTGDFGMSLATGERAIDVVLACLPATAALAALALAVAFAIAIPLGAWLGLARGGSLRGLSSWGLFVLQGTPGFVAGLVLIQVFAVEWPLLPSMGMHGADSFVLPVATLTAFLMPKQARLVATQVAGAYREDYVRTALAIGTPPRELLFRHVLPNALIGSVALLGTQAALLLSGAVVTETIFGWPGLGSLLLTSTQTLDFPVLQTITIVVAVLVFAANGFADLAVAALDPRIRDGASQR